jgi:hypothetical protein
VRTGSEDASRTSDSTRRERNVEVDLALLADAATIDASGKLNILGIFDHLSAASFPVRHPQMVMVLRFSAGVHEAGQHKVEIVLHDPDGHEVVRVDGDMNLAPGPSGVADGVHVPQILNMGGLVFPKAGRYGFDVRVDGEHHVTLPITVSGAHGRAQA